MFYVAIQSRFLSALLPIKNLHFRPSNTEIMSHDDPFVLYKPIITITKFSGIQFPLKNRQIYLITTILTLTFFAFAIFKSQETIETVHLLPKHISIEQFDRFSLYISFFHVLHVFVFYLVNGAKLFELLKKLRDFDEAIADGLNVIFTTQGRVRRTVFYFVAFFIAATFVYLARIYVFYSIYNQIQFHTITYAFIFYLQHNVILHYVFFLILIHHRFRFLNENVANFRETNPFLTKRYLRVVKILHEHLSGVARAINGVFGAYQAHMIVKSSVDQVMDCFCLFFVIKNRFDENKSMFGGDVFDLLTDWFLKMVFQLFLVCAVAQKAESEVS